MRFPTIWKKQINLNGIADSNNEQNAQDEHDVGRFRRFASQVGGQMVYNFASLDRSQSHTSNE